MNCAELEELICDYVDGTLTAARKAEVERHLEACPACAEMARDSAAAVAFMERAADVEPPPELITRILFDAPWTQKAPAKGRGWCGWLGKLIAPDSAAAVRDGNGDDDSFVLDSFALRADAAVEGRGSAAERSLGGAGRPGAPRLGADREVLRKPESGVPDPNAAEGLAATGGRPEGEQASEPKTDDRKLPVKAAGIKAALNPGERPLQIHPGHRIEATR